MNRLEQQLKNCPDEQTAQNFFEANVKALTGSVYLLGNGAIRKFPIGTDYVTDFAFVNPTSGACYIHLIELESPTKLIFTKDDRFTKEFNEGLQQVRDWMTWCFKNQTALYDQLKPLQIQSNDAIMTYVARGMLIFGRRAEFTNARRSERWEGLIASNPLLKIRTFDGVASDANDYLSHPTTIDDPVCLAYRGRSYVVL